MLMVKKTPLFGRGNVKKVLEKAFTLAHVCVCGGEVGGAGIRWGLGSPETPEEQVTLLSPSESP